MRRFGLLLLAAVCSVGAPSARAGLPVPGEILVRDSELREVISVDPVSGNATLLSAATTGAGTNLVAARGLALDALGSILVADANLGALLRVDPASGDRSVVSSSSVGSGFPLKLPASVIELPGGELLVADAEREELTRIDPDTGDRTVVSSDTVGTGRDFGLPAVVALESSGSVLVLDNSLDALLRVDPVTGDRSLLSAPSAGAGPHFGILRGLALETNGQILVSDFGLDALLRVDPVSGNRSVLSSGAVGSGPMFSFPSGIAVESDGSILVANVFPPALFRVQPGTGDRSVVSSATQGAGPPLEFPVDVTVESDGKLLVADFGAAAIVRIDPASGDRQVVSASGVGAGPDFAAKTGLDVVLLGAVVVPAGSGVADDALGGAGVTGGIDFSFSSTGGGTLTAEAIRPAASGAVTAFETPARATFALPGDPAQLWEIGYDGPFSGSITLTFAYEGASLAPGIESSLAVYRHTAGSWVQLPTLGRNLSADTITVLTTGFSQFALGAPVVGSDTLILTGSAEGGSVSLRIGLVSVSVSTGAGDSAEQVAAALAAAIGADGELFSAGITASANGAQVSTNGLITDIEIAEAGLALGTAAAPSLGAPGLLLVVAALAATGLWLALARTREA